MLLIQFSGYDATFFNSGLLNLGMQLLLVSLSEIVSQAVYNKLYVKVESTYFHVAVNSC